MNDDNGLTDVKAACVAVIVLGIEGAAAAVLTEATVELTSREVVRQAGQRRHPVFVAVAFVAAA